MIKYCTSLVITLFNFPTKLPKLYELRSNTAGERGEELYISARGGRRGAPEMGDVNRHTIIIFIPPGESNARRKLKVCTGMMQIVV